MKTPKTAVFLAALLFSVLAARVARAEGIQLAIEKPSLERWMYPFNFDPASRPISPTFASFDPRFDTRDAQFLIGWDTAEWIPTNRPAGRYLLRSARLVLTVARTETFIYDGTFDSYRTFATNSPVYLPDADAGRPIELYGAGYRNGFTAATFPQGGYYGPLNAFTSTNISIATRSVYAAQFDADGQLIDVSNNVGQYNAGWTNAPFEAEPWAIGVCPTATPGELVADDSKFTFDVNVADRRILGYFQDALREGYLRLVVSSLSPAAQITPGGTGQGGLGSYPQWATRDNLLYDAPRLELDGVLVSDTDTDGDGLPDDWENFYFGGLTKGPTDDPDADGYANGEEFQRGTDPTRADPPRGDPHPTAVSGLHLLKVGADGNAILQWSGSGTAGLSVEVSLDLMEWRAGLGAFDLAQPGVVRWVENDPAVPPAGRARAFYRVVTR